MDEDNRPSLSVDGDTFRNIIVNSTQVAAKETLESVRQSLNESYNTFTEGHELTSVEKEELATMTRLRYAQFQTVVAEVLTRFLDTFLADLMALETPAGAVSASSGEIIPPPTSSGEPSWQKLHEMIGFKSAEAK